MWREKFLAIRLKVGHVGIIDLSTNGHELTNILCQCQNRFLILLATLKCLTLWIYNLISSIAISWRWQGEDYILVHWPKWDGLFVQLEIPAFWVEKCILVEFQRVMDQVLASLDLAKCYINDIIVLDSTMEVHHLQNVFECLGGAWVEITPKKM